ncbi:MAG: ribonuclease PH [Verrucomicrobiae bacterium]|nr:ribonuclease PH [Verrucomicrobiae bacterium]
MPQRSSKKRAFQRLNHRRFDQLRPVRFQLDVAPHALGSVLCSFGKTEVICAVTVEESVPRWMKEQGVTGGWLTAEYSMLPYSTLERKQRDSSRGKIDGRSQEIQRLIGRSLRAILDLEKLGQRSLWVDCDVLRADGGTRTASITGAYVALALACQKLQKQKLLTSWPLKDSVAAISVGLAGDQPLLDLCYEEDKDAAVDMNVVMTGRGRFIEIQGNGEESTFSEKHLQELLKLAKKGIQQLIKNQKKILK